MLNFQVHRQTSLTSTKALDLTLPFIMISGTSRNAFRVHANFRVFLSHFRLLLVLHTARFLISFFHLVFPSVVFCCRCASTFVTNVVYSPHLSDPIGLPFHRVLLSLYFHLRHECSLLSSLLRSYCTSFAIPFHLSYSVPSMRRDRVTAPRHARSRDRRSRGGIHEVSCGGCCLNDHKRELG